MAKTKNKNIIPIKSIDELNNEFNFDDFEYKQHFEHICNLIPNKELEKVTIEVIDEQKCNDEGFVYVFVIQNFHYFNQFIIVIFVFSNI